jgi:hypothetical protein
MSLPTRSRQKQHESEQIAKDTARFLATRGNRIEVLPAFGAPMGSPLKTRRELHDESGERAKRRRKPEDE